MVVSPSFLALTATALDGELHLDLGPEAFHALRLIPGADLEAHRPVRLAVRRRESRQHRWNGGRVAHERGPVLHAAIRIGGGRVGEGALDGVRAGQESQGHAEVRRRGTREGVENVAGDRIARHGGSSSSGSGCAGGCGNGGRVGVGASELVLVEAKAVGDSAQLLAVCRFKGH